MPIVRFNRDTTLGGQRYIAGTTHRLTRFHRDMRDEVAKLVFSGVLTYVKPEALVKFEQAAKLLDRYGTLVATGRVGSTVDVSTLKQVLAAAEIVQRDLADVRVDEMWCPNDCGPLVERNSYGALKAECPVCDYRYSGCEACE